MGYTHHWKFGAEVDPSAFAQAAADCRALAEASDVSIAGRPGTGLPVFDEDHIEFNGSAPNHCEPFIMTLGEHRNRWAFCKTNWKPYDVVVVACLIAFAQHVPGFLVSSDGGDEDWEQGRLLCGRVLGYGADFRLPE